MIKIAFFDFDNTLFSHKTHQISPSTYKALELLKQNNVKICLCTGRCKYEMDHYFDISDINFDYYIYLNGLQVTDQNNNIIFKKTIEGKDKENIIRLFKEKEIPIIICNNNDYYINFTNQQVYYTCVLNASSPIPNIHSYQEDDLYMISILPGEKEDFKEYFQQILPDFYLTKWTTGSYDVLPRGFSKADGIKKLVEYLHFLKEETISFGDGENDIEMLQTTSLSVAMGNSDQIVKDAAGYVTDDIDEDGIYNALKHFEII